MWVIYIPMYIEQFQIQNTFVDGGGVQLKYRNKK